MMSAPLDPRPEPRPFTPAEVRRALRTSMVAWGLLGSAWMALVTGVVYVTFVRDKLHFSTFSYALLMSLPFAGSLAQLLGSYWTETKRQRRRQCWISLVLSRSVWLLVAALPWVVPEQLHGLRVGLLLSLMAFSSVMSHISMPAGFSWFADIVPEHIRARYLARRAAVSTLTVIVVSAAVSELVDRSQSLTMFTVIFLAAAVLGLADICLYCLRVREAPMPPHEGPPWRMRNVLLTPLQSPPFRGYLLYAFFEAFRRGVVGPFWWLMALEYLKIGAFWSNMYVMLLPMAFTAVALPFWGGACDRFGAKALVRLGIVTSLLYPILWSLATPRAFHVLLFVPAVIGGFFSAALQTAEMSMMFSLTPRENRSAYMACLMLASNLGLAVSMILGGALAQALKPVVYHAGGLTFMSYHFLMLISVVLTLLSLLFILPRLPAEEHVGAGEVLRDLARASLEKVKGEREA
jgi:MFS family permease